MPEAYYILTHKEKKGSGGWLEASAKELIGSCDISLYVATASPLVKSMLVLQGSGITYYVFPFEFAYSAKPYEQYMRRMQEEIKPEVVHVHGTEFPYGLAYLNVAGSERVVVSMQGVMSRIAEHYTDGLNKWQIYINITLRDIRLKTIPGEKREYQKRGMVEKETLKKAKYVMGRTDFDKTFVLSVNPECVYIKVNESLRESFYQNQWRYEECIPQTIFLSQSNYPVKGLHQFLKALPLIREKYPDVKVRIAGEDIKKHNTKAYLIRYSGYGSIIFHILSKWGLHDCVSFTGLLNETEMMNEYLKANVFICPSTCENSSNSIAEAQILGTPCIASNRGGNPDMIPNNRCGLLFDFEDTNKLAELVCEVFQKSPDYDNSEVRELALKRHNRQTNLEKTISVYKTIQGNNEG